MADMAETAAISMTPGQYAARLLTLAAKASKARSPSELGYCCFDNFERFLAKDATDWEKGLLQEIRGAVASANEATPS